GARPRALRHLLLALPRRHRRRSWHSRAPRLQAAVVLPRRPAAPGAPRLLLRRPANRLRGGAELRRAGSLGGPLGDRGLQPRTPALAACRRLRPRGRGARPSRPTGTRGGTAGAGTLTWNRT